MQLDNTRKRKEGIGWTATREGEKYIWYHWEAELKHMHTHWPRSQSRHLILSGSEMNIQRLCNATCRVNRSWLRAIKPHELMQTGTFTKNGNFKCIKWFISITHKNREKAGPSFRDRKCCHTKHMVVQAVRLDLILLYWWVWCFTENWLILLDLQADFHRFPYTISAFSLPSVLRKCLQC